MSTRSFFFRAANMRLAAGLFLAAAADHEEPEQQPDESIDDESGAIMGPATPPAVRRRPPPAALSAAASKAAHKKTNETTLPPTLRVLKLTRHQASLALHHKLPRASDKRDEAEGRTRRTGSRRKAKTGKRWYSLPRQPWASLPSLQSPSPGLHPVGLRRRSPPSPFRPPPSAFLLAFSRRNSSNRSASIAARAPANRRW